MKIQVFGPGCAKCRETEQLALEAVRASGLDATVEKVSDLKEMMKAGVLTTPAITIDGTLACSGRIPDQSEVVSWIMTAAEKKA